MALTKKANAIFLSSFLVAVLSLAMGIIIYVPAQWFYTEFKLAPRPKGGALNANLNPNPSIDGIQREMIKFQCKTNSSTSTEKIWRCDGWLYTPIHDLSLKNKDKQFPVIIMAHGIGATKDMGLDAFAQYFSKNGFMVLLFDYLHFGKSDGYPRHKINPFQHVMDYQSAIKYCKLNKDIDNNRIGLWGTSYAGGHVLTVTSKENNIKAVVSQMPFLGPMPDESPFVEMAKRGYKNVLIGLFGAVSSKVRRIFGFTQLYSRLYGHINDNKQLALNYWENFDGNEKQWLSKHPVNRDNDWRNAVLSESIFDMIKYKPINYINKIKTKNTKILIVKAKTDKLCPVERMDYIINQLQCEQHTEDTTHFGMYTGKIFESIIKIQTEFFKKHLKHDKQFKTLD